MLAASAMSDRRARILTVSPTSFVTCLIASKCFLMDPSPGQTQEDCPGAECVEGISECDYDKRRGKQKTKIAPLPLYPSTPLPLYPFIPLNPLSLVNCPLILQKELYSTWSKGAPFWFPLYDSATRLPVPVIMTARELPLDQPCPSTISWMMADKSGVR